ncbi:MAG TPA: tetratricopeptide repeat protein [Sedimentisphaerales bacterium]|nr:tetratricopeptide repeat protein [Sedimentisphaerales bacterium]
MNTEKVLVLLTCLLLFAESRALSADAALSRDEVVSLFRQANDAFRQANTTGEDQEMQRLYDKAILSFERIINDGQIRNARLYYNLANAYLLKGDLGRAVLNYRRAERLDQTDPDIRKNLAFALSKRVDKVPIKTRKRVLETLFFWHYDFSLRTRFAVALVAFGLVCVALTVMLWLGRVAGVTVTAVLCGILTVCFLVSVIVEVREQARRTSGVITTEQVTAHQADWEDSPPSFKEPLHAGTEFDLVEHRRGWLHIRLADDSDGWIPEAAAELI